MSSELTPNDIKKIHLQATEIAATKSVKRYNENKRRFSVLEARLIRFLYSKKDLKRDYEQAVEDLTQKFLAIKEIEQFPEHKKAVTEKEVKKEMTELQKLRKEFRERRNRNNDRDR